MRTRLLILTGIIVLVLCATAYADMFMYTDDEGVVVFTDKTNPGAVRLTNYASQKRESFKNDIQTLISKASKKHGVDASLINAVIRVESNYNESAISKKGAMGLMQLMPTTASQMGAYNPFNPEQNIDAGVRYLKYLVNRFEGDLKLALAAYNAGPTNVEKYGGVPPITETRNYIKKVFSIYKGKNNLKKAKKPRKPVYKLVLEDGTILYTNSHKYLKEASRL